MSYQVLPLLTLTGRLTLSGLTKTTLTGLPAVQGSERGRQV